MQKAELQIILRLLQDRNNINQTYRKLATQTNTSLGSVHTAMQKLIDKGYIVNENGTRMLRKRTALIDKWTRAYADGLKESFFLARFTFLSSSVKKQWQEIQLPPTLSWGGEPAAVLLDNYLTPQQWTIYAADTPNDLIATGRMIPKADGEIFVYQKFWQEEQAPLLVIYADLLATEDDRCREAAERIRPLL